MLEKPDCNPVACERAKGHYDRVNEAVFDMLMHETEISRELIAQYAEKHCVCPFEMCLDVTLWADGIICDYNYVFDRSQCDCQLQCNTGSAQLAERIVTSFKLGSLR